MQPSFRALLTAAVSIAPLAIGCGGATQSDPATTTGGTSGTGSSATAGGASSGSASSGSASSSGDFRGDHSAMPSFGGWAYGNDPADAIAKAGFEWFETGYPGDTATNDTLRAAHIRPFAYINLGELEQSLKDDAGYTGPILRTNGDWGTQLVDVTDQSWQDWLVRRADFAYQTGSRGVKWDVATPDVPPGKTRDDVNNAIASVMQRILTQHPDMKFIYNQGFLFALAYPQFVHGVETEGLFSASSAPGAWLQPWQDPWYWGPQFDQAKQIHGKGVPIFVAEYFDPSGDQASQLYDAITAQGFVPYITNDHWDIRGRGYNVPAGW